MTDPIQVRLKELIQEKCKELCYQIIALETMPDHVHLFIEADARIAPNIIIGQIKGFTSHELRNEFPELKKRLPTLWTRSFFCSTHGHISDKLVKQYIEDQRGI